MKKISGIVLIVTLLVYVILCLRFYYFSRDNVILQVSGALFQKSILRQRRVVVCENVAEIPGFTEEYLDLYALLGELLPQDKTVDEFPGLGDFFSGKKDVALPEGGYWYYRHADIATLSDYYDILTNPFMLRKEPLVCFLSKDASTQVLETHYDGWCAFCLQGQVAMDVYSNQGWKRTPETISSPGGMIRTGKFGGEETLRANRVLLQGGQFIFFPYGTCFSMSSLDDFGLVLHLRWATPLTHQLFLASAGRAVTASEA